MKRNSVDKVIDGILQHDALLLKQMYQKFFPKVKGFVMRKGGDEARAKDIFQDAVLVVHEMAKQPDFLLTSQFSTLLHGICRNLWRKQQQKKSASQVMIANEDLYNHQSDWELEYGSLKWERRKLYDKAFSQLGERCQNLLLLFFQKVKMEEIAQKLGANSANNSNAQALDSVVVRQLDDLVDDCVSNYCGKESYPTQKLPACAPRASRRKYWGSKTLRTAASLTIPHKD